MSRKKITHQDIEDIKLEYFRGKDAETLAGEYGVTSGYIQKIIEGRIDERNDYHRTAKPREIKVTLEMIEATKDTINIGDKAICSVQSNKTNTYLVKTLCPVVSKSRYVFTVEHKGRKGTYYECFSYTDALLGKIKFA